jgi:hypothetical protein
MNLAALQGEDWPCKTALPVSVDLVHQNRQGASVLRYGVRRTGTSSASAAGHVYGKVYPNRTTGGGPRRCPEGPSSPGSCGLLHASA